MTDQPPTDRERARVAELERLILLMAERIWIMSSHLSLLALRPELRPGRRLKQEP